MAVGEIGMSINEFYSITPVEYHFIAKYYMLKTERDYQIMRLQTTYLMNLQLEKKLEPEDLFRLSSDQLITKKKDLPTREEMLEAAERYHKE